MQIPTLPGRAVQTQAGGFASLSLSFLPYKLEVTISVISEAVVRNT